MNIFECAIIKNMVGGGGANPELETRIESLEKRVDELHPSMQLFNIDAWSDKNSIKHYGDKTAIVAGGWYPRYVYALLKDVCPKLEFGKTYTLSFSVNVSDDSYMELPWVTCGNNGDSIGASCIGEGADRFAITFTMESENDILSFQSSSGDQWEYDEEGNGWPVTVTMETRFFDVMINEGTEPLPWEPYRG